MPGFQPAGNRFCLSFIAFWEVFWVSRTSRCIVNDKIGCTQNFTFSKTITWLGCLNERRRWTQSFIVKLGVSILYNFACGIFVSKISWFSAPELYVDGVSLTAGTTRRTLFLADRGVLIGFQPRMKHAKNATATSTRYFWPDSCQPASRKTNSGSPDDSWSASPRLHEEETYHEFFQGPLLK
jgi:hypothetical protein